MRNIEVDWTRCDAHGMCALLVPERIELDQWGFPIVAAEPVEDELLVHARRAAMACPSLALRVTPG